MDMVISQILLDWETGILNLVGMRYPNLQWCELGNQYFQNFPAKRLYLNLGVHHTSIDLNKKDGALPIDLNKSIPKYLKNHFDVITDYGTLEHVDYQYQVFKNIHDMCKKNGLIIHALPRIDNWQNHCRYYYTKKFFEDLASMCNYKTISLKIFDKDTYKSPRNLIGVCYLKKNNESFITKERFEKLNILDMGSKYTGNYTKKLSFIFGEAIDFIKQKLKPS